MRVDAWFERRAERAVPADGPLTAVLGYVLFYVVVERATPAVVAVLTDALPDLPGSTVGLGLALFLWVVLALTVVDQATRQLAALGLLERDDPADWLWTRVGLERVPATWYLAALAVGGTLAAVTVDAALAAVPVLVRAAASLGSEPFPAADLAVLGVFAVAFDVASTALDRLVLGGVRATLAD
jgi:hypothetical protein